MLHKQVVKGLALQGINDHGRWPDHWQVCLYYHQSAVHTNCATSPDLVCHSSQRQAPATAAFEASVLIVKCCCHCCYSACSMPVKCRVICMCTAQLPWPATTPLSVRVCCPVSSLHSTVLYPCWYRIFLLTHSCCPIRPVRTPAHYNTQPELPWRHWAGWESTFRKRVESVLRAKHCYSSCCQDSTDVRRTHVCNNGSLPVTVHCL